MRPPSPTPVSLAPPEKPVSPRKPLFSKAVFPRANFPQTYLPRSYVAFPRETRLISILPFLRASLARKLCHSHAIPALNLTFSPPFPSILTIIRPSFPGPLFGLPRNPGHGLAWRPNGEGRNHSSVPPARARWNGSTGARFPTSARALWSSLGLPYSCRSLAVMLSSRFHTSVVLRCLLAASGQPTLG